MTIAEYPQVQIGIVEGKVWTWECESDGEVDAAAVTAGSDVVETAVMVLWRWEDHEYEWVERQRLEERKDADGVKPGGVEVLELVSGIASLFTVNKEKRFKGWER
jgi:hypothetical protein